MKNEDKAQIQTEEDKESWIPFLEEIILFKEYIYIYIYLCGTFPACVQPECKIILETYENQIIYQSAEAYENSETSKAFTSKDAYLGGNGSS